MESYEQAYKKYLEERREKFGADFGEDYYGSAFHRKVDTHPEIDGDFLRNIMPNKHQPIRTSHLDEIEADCLKYMKNRAKDKQFFCRYTVPGIFPGIPKYDPAEVTKELYKRLTKRKNINVFADQERVNTLFISWIRTSESEKK
jgi:hypothetical protein